MNREEFSEWFGIKFGDRNALGQGISSINDKDFEIYPGIFVTQGENR
ncbi:hypothetical protein [Leptospira broomii]|nr:hypothetical protein [Leptospira broomii]